MASEPSTPLVVHERASAKTRLHRWRHGADLRRRVSGLVASVALLAAVTGAIELLKAHEHRGDHALTSTARKGLTITAESALGESDSEF
jgi:hypothetical protein